MVVCLGYSAAGTKCYTEIQKIVEVEWKLSGEAEKGSVALRCTIWGTASLLGTLTVPAAPWEYESSSETMRRHLKDADDFQLFQLAALP